MQIDVLDLLGVRYKKNGRDENGLDCFGLVIEVSKRFGHELPDFEYLKTNWEVFNENKEKIAKECKLKKVTSPCEGDLLLFKVCCAFENHIGVYLGDDQFIHCDKYGVHIQSLSDYSSELGSVYRWY